MNYLEFTREVNGFNFYNKKTNEQVFRYQMYWSKLTPLQCFQRFNTSKITRSYS